MILHTINSLDNQQIYSPWIFQNLLSFSCGEVGNQSREPSETEMLKVLCICTTQTFKIQASYIQAKISQTFVLNALAIYNKCPFPERRKCAYKAGFMFYNDSLKHIFFMGKCIPFFFKVAGIQNIGIPSILWRNNFKVSVGNFSCC